MVFERISQLPATVHKDVERIEPVLMGSIVINNSPTGDVESPRRVSEIEDGVQMSNSHLFMPPSSSGRPLRRSPRRKEVLDVDDDSSSSESPSVVEITKPKCFPVKNHVHPSQRLPVSSKHMTTHVSSPRSPSTSKLRVRARAGPVPRSTKTATSKPFPTVLPLPSSARPPSISTNDKPPVSKKPKTHHHAPPSARNSLNPKSRDRSPLLATSGALTSLVELDDLPVLKYDLEKDPTEEVYEFPDQFHERSPYSAILSARFIHAHLFERPPGSTASNDEPTSSEVDLVTEFIEPEAIGSVGPRQEATPSYSVDSAEGLRNSHPSSRSGNSGLEDNVHFTDPFAVMTMDDVINQPPAIDPSLLGGTPAFSDLRSPSPALLTFRDFHLQKKTPKYPPSSGHLALKVGIPTHTSTSGSNSAKTLGDPMGNPSGGTAKFYKNGELQTPPHLSNSQSRGSRSAKATPSAYPRRYPSPEIDSPLTELSAWGMFGNGTASTSSIMRPSEEASTTDEDATVISNGSSTPPPRVIKTATARKQKGSANQKGPYNIVAVNESSYCHQCRRSTSHPKMQCHACPRRYCILCIVKRYHDIEFHQFKEDFDCPACLDKCNCTSCCDKRKELYVTTRHIKFDTEMMAKLLSGEIRSLPHLSASLSGPPKRLEPGDDPISLRRRLPPSTTGKLKAHTRRKRAPSRRYASDDDDYDENEASKAQSAGARVKPSKAALQTRRMLEESGSGRYWGAVYSLSGERVGMSYVGKNLQDVTVQTVDLSSASVKSCSPFQERRVYVGKWQDAWGPCPETPDDSNSEGETHPNKRGRNRKDLGRIHFHYVGNPSIIKAWRRAQSKAVQSPPVAPLPPSDDFITHIPSSDNLPFGKGCNGPGATDASPSVTILIDEEDEGALMTKYWNMEAGLSPKETNSPLLTPSNILGPGLSSVSNILDACSTSSLESCDQLVPRKALTEAVVSSLEAIGAAVLISNSPPLSTLDF